MKIAIVVDESRARELAHARIQAGRLRRGGFGVVGPSRRLAHEERDSIAMLHVVGEGKWRSARRLGRHLGVPVLYDHPPGTVPPPRLRRADAVIAAGHSDATALAHALGSKSRLVLILPDPPRGGDRPRPRLRQQLGIGGRTIALQEAAGISRRQAEVLIHSVASLSAVDLVFLGGDGWNLQADLLNLAEEVQASARVHFFGDVPIARRIEYLGEADVGLAFADGGGHKEGLAAADVFEMLGIPFVTSDEGLGPQPVNRIAPGSNPAELRAAILEASERGRMPMRDDSSRVLCALVVGLAMPGGGEEAGPEPTKPPPARSNGKPVAGPDVAVASSLLSSAKTLADRGEVEDAVELYAQVADGSDSQHAAAAAAALARLNARTEARLTIDRIIAAGQASALATARLGEAAAVLGDLNQARALVEEVLADASAPDVALRTAIRVLEQSGEPRAALRLARQAGDDASVVRIEGTLESYDPSWLPPSTDTSAPPRPRARRTFSLLETSLPHVSSGYTYRAQTLLRAQRRVGLEPTVLTRLGFPETRGLSAPRVEEVDGITHHRVGLPGVRRYSSVPVSEQLRVNLRWAADLGRELRPEAIVAATPHLNGLVGLALRNELGVPMVYDVRGFPEMTWAVRNGGEETDVFGLRRVAETRCMREADLVTTLSETMRRHIVSRGVAAERVFVLPHAVDTDAFAPQGRDQRLAANLGLEGRTIVGYISSLVAYEGVETLIDAIAHARREDPSIAGLIVGSGDLQRSLEAQATRLGLNGHVVFTGRVDAGEISDYYSLIDIFVCPRQDHEVTRYVTPLKPFEAMAAGCCIAVSDLPTLREAVRDGACGVLFPAGDHEALAVTILDLGNRPERRCELEVAARDHALANHGFDSLCAELERVWAELGLGS